MQMFLKAERDIIFGPNALVNLQRGKRLWSGNTPVGPGRQRREGVAHRNTCNFYEIAQNERGPEFWHRPCI